MPKGPTKVEYEVKENRCFDCDYHSHHLVVSGPNPEREHYCTHESLMEMKFILHSSKGRYIGRDDKTPEWCPVVNKI